MRLNKRLLSLVLQLVPVSIIPNATGHRHRHSPASSDLARRHYPGVGFDLTLNYGTAALFYGNGSAVAITRIEGDAKYKNLMSRLTTDAFQSSQIGQRPTSPQSSQLPHYPDEESDTLLRYHRLPTPQKGSERLFRRVGYRTSGKALDSDVVTLEAMFMALKTATEAYLGVPLNTTAISVPYQPHSLDHHRMLMDTALQRVDLGRSLGGLASAPEAVAFAHCFGLSGRGPCVDHDVSAPPRIVLTVDYSRAALTVAKMVEHSGRTEVVDITHKPSLGSDALARLEKSGEYNKFDDRHFAESWELLAEIIESSIPQYKNLSNTVPRLLIYGECTTEERLKRVLFHGLGMAAVAPYEPDTSRALSSLEGTVDPVSCDMSFPFLWPCLLESISRLADEPKIDPVFVAAIGAAAAAKEYDDERGNGDFNRHLRKHSRAHSVPVLDEIGDHRSNGSDRKRHDLERFY